MRVFLGVIVFLLMALGTGAPVCAADKPDPEISVTAEGSAAVVNGDIAKAEDEALGDAKRNAVEKALGVLVKADTLGLDYQVMVDSILTRSEGYISSWNKVPNSRKIQRVQGHELLTIKIEAQVKLTNLIGDATDIGPIYSAVQRPRIMVLIDDEVDGKKTNGVATCSTAVMRALKSRGFEVADADAVKHVLQKQPSDSVKGASDAALAQGAEILILGTAKAVEGPTDDSGTVKTASAIVDARVVYADTAQVLYTAKQVQGRGASFGDPADAKFKALSDAGDRLVRADSQKFVTQILALWTMEVQSGRVYKVVAEGLSYNDVDVLQKALKDLRGHVEFIGQASFADKRAVVNVRNRLTPQQFRDRVGAIKIGKKPVEIRESSGLAVCVRVK